MDTIARDDLLSTSEKVKHKRNLETLRYVLPNLLKTHERFFEMVLALRRENANLLVLRRSGALVRDERSHVLSMLSSSPDKTVLTLEGAGMTSIAETWKLRLTSMDLQSLQQFAVHHIKILQSLQEKSLEYQCLGHHVKSHADCKDGNALVCLRAKQAAIEMTMAKCVSDQAKHSPSPAWHAVDIMFNESGVNYNADKQEFHVCFSPPSVPHDRDMFFDARLDDASGVPRLMETTEDHGDETGSVHIERSGSSVIVDEHGEWHNFPIDRRSYIHHFSSKRCVLLDEGLRKDIFVRPSPYGCYRVRISLQHSKIKRIKGFRMFFKVTARQTTHRGRSPILFSGTPTMRQKAGSFPAQFGCSVHPDRECKADGGKFHCATDQKCYSTCVSCFERPSFVISNLGNSCCGRTKTGYFLKPASLCEQIPCTGAKPGEFYLHGGGSKDTCPVHPCTNANPGTMYVAFGRNANTCATIPCRSASVGYYLSGNGVCTQSECTRAKVGQYYTTDGGISDSCAIADCTNAKVGFKYISSARGSNSCDTTACPSAPTGFYLNTAGECLHAPCTKAPANHHYTSHGGTADECQFSSNGDVFTDSDGDKVLDSDDECPQDPQNDLDGDSICADVDPCPLHALNQIDQYGRCGEFAVDSFDDSDSDAIAYAEDSCPYDDENDVDGDNMCAMTYCIPSENEDCKEHLSDPCPLDRQNDIDNDNNCADMDPCPFDPNDDEDKDGKCAFLICGADSQTFKSVTGENCRTYRPGQHNHQFCVMDEVCGECPCACAKQCGDQCPQDANDDSDGDNICDSDDTCPRDRHDDSDGDNICDTDDPCPVDQDNECDVKRDNSSDFKSSANTIDNSDPYINFIIPSTVTVIAVLVLISAVVITCVVKKSAVKKREHQNGNEDARDQCSYAD